MRNSSFYISWISFLLIACHSVDEKKIDELIVKLKDHTQKDVFKISSVTGKGISSILRVLHDNVIKTKKDEDIKSWQP